MGNSLTQVRSFSKQARQQIGFELEMVQNGAEPADWKPLPTVGSGANEIRVHAGGEYRVIYVAKFGGAIYVLHAFAKKTAKTPGRVIELASRRYRQALQMEEKRRQ